MMQVQMLIFVVCFPAAVAANPPVQNSFKTTGNASVFHPGWPVRPSQAKSSSTFFGRIVGALNDVDRDGVVDYAVGMADVGDCSGAIRVFSGKSHSTLFELPSAEGKSYLGGTALWPLVDIDGDGIAELGASVGARGESADIISVAKRRQLFRINAPPHELLSCVDLDSDGRPDILHCSGVQPSAFSGVSGKPLDPALLPNLDGMTPARVRESVGEMRMMGLVIRPGGVVSLYDCSGSLRIASRDSRFTDLKDRLVRSTSTTSAKSIQCMVDVDLDGQMDLVQYARIDDYDERTTAHKYALLLSVITTSDQAVAIHERWETDQDDPPCLANCIALPGDINGDHVQDLIVSVPSAFRLAGGVFARSGKDGSELWAVRPIEAQGRSQVYNVETGVSIATLSDIDGDKIDDVLIGCGNFIEGVAHENTGTVLVVSGRTGRELHRVGE